MQNRCGGRMEFKYIEGTSAEQYNEINTGFIKHVVFDFDGTISLIRDGWQNVMVPMMVEFLQTETETKESQEELEDIVVEFVDRLTGKQTIYQMMQLADEIEKRGVVNQKILFRIKMNIIVDYFQLWKRELPIYLKEIFHLIVYVYQTHSNFSKNFMKWI